VGAAGLGHDADAEVRGPGRPRDPDVDRAVVDAAVELISEFGFDGLTMEAVAKRAGVAKATLYRRFPCKVDLAVAACEAVSPTLPPLPDTGSLRDDLLDVLEVLVNKLRTSDTGRLMPAMVAAAPTNPEVREALRRVSTSRRTRTADVLRRAVARGEVREDLDVEVVADVLTGPVVYRHLINGKPLTAKVLGSIVDQVLFGALPR
jgi:AcrR family transcriptional regulator